MYFLFMHQFIKLSQLSHIKKRNKLHFVSKKYILSCICLYESMNCPFVVQKQNASNMNYRIEFMISNPI